MLHVIGHILVRVDAGKGGGSGHQPAQQDHPLSGKPGGAAAPKDDSENLEEQPESKDPQWKVHEDHVKVGADQMSCRVFHSDAPWRKLASRDSISAGEAVSSVQVAPHQSDKSD